MSWRSALYSGRLAHSRRDRYADQYDYPFFFFGLDLDELDQLDQRLRLFGRDKRALFSLRTSDYFHGQERTGDTDLREAAIAFAREGGVTRPIERVELLAQVRMIGYVFNPVVFYLLRDQDDELVCAIAEVNNTYGGRHRYLLSDHNLRDDGRYHTEKAFYVSPYIHHARTYAWSLSVKGKHRTIAVDVLDDSGHRFFRATMHGRRQELSDRSLARAAVRYPLMTLQIIGLIQWRALLLRRRGVEHKMPGDDDRADQRRRPPSARPSGPHVL